ncbi:MAG: lipid-A-disaccharide synthase [Gammaproteobacteria bacterium]|jgi:lipid-A-disaccharide synthase|nr:lipid-A-disaccharide synthase [Gammaproteobacteria bacterium]
MRFGIVVGEASGDLLGAGLIAEIKRQYPDATFEGIAGPLMQKMGARSLYPMERLAVMGIVEILGRYRELSAMRKNLIKHFCSNPPDVFIGVDSPEFNIHIAQKLREAGIKTVQYVSPQVWAWRQYRVKKIAQAVDLMLTLFPFEEEFYASRSVTVRCVGHPLADAIPMHPDKSVARENLKIPPDKEVVALLPGSRGVEVHYLAEVFIQAAQWCLDRRPNLFFVAPLANESRRKQFEQALYRKGSSLPIKLVTGNSREVMTAADVVVLASGTATLEGMLLKKPLVVAYKLSQMSYFIFKFLSQVSHYALPNLLARKPLVPELIQHNATPEKIGKEVLAYFHDPEKVATLQLEFEAIHNTLRKNASHQAAEAVIELAKDKNKHNATTQPQYG